MSILDLFEAISMQTSRGDTYSSLESVRGVHSTHGSTFGARFLKHLRKLADGPEDTVLSFETLHHVLQQPAKHLMEPFAANNAEDEAVRKYCLEVVKILDIQIEEDSLTRLKSSGKRPATRDKGRRPESNDARSQSSQEEGRAPKSGQLEDILLTDGTVAKRDSRGRKAFVSRRKRK